MEFYVLVVVPVDERTDANADFAVKVCAEKIPDVNQKFEIDFNNPNIKSVRGKQHRQAGKEKEDGVREKDSVIVTEIVPAGKRFSLPTVICRTLEPDE
ncbi:MAG: hypothetical protein ACYC75_01735 [Minisyncoccota bacterium]